MTMKPSLSVDKAQKSQVNNKQHVKSMLPLF